MFFLPCSKLRSLRNSKLVYSEFTSFEHAKRWSSNSIIWNCSTFRREVKKEENSFKTLQLTLQVYLRFQPELLLRLLLWLGLVWLRELGDRSDLHAPIFHHYGTAFIHGHEANPIPLRMAVAVAQLWQSGTSMLSPISGATQTISVEFMRREWVSCFLFNNTITHRSNLSLTLISTRTENIHVVQGYL